MKTTRFFGAIPVAALALVNADARAEHITVTLDSLINPPGMYQGAYRNVVFFLDSDCYRHYSYPPYSGGSGWMIKRIRPSDPPIYPLPIEIAKTDVQVDTQFWDPGANEYRFIFIGCISMFFWYEGTYLFRNNLYWDYPPELPNTPEFVWPWQEGSSTVIMGQDTAAFESAIPDAEIHIIQTCPRNWLPVIEGYIDSTGQPNYTDFMVHLQASFRSYEPPKAYKLRWLLDEISWYDGACMNYPNAGSNPGPPPPPTWQDADLKILHQYNPHLECGWDSTRKAFFGITPTAIRTGDTTEVVVTCYDFGAHGNISLEALDSASGMWYGLTSYMEADSEYKYYSTIPIDEDGLGYYKDKLADFWEELMLADPHCPDTVTSILQITRTSDRDWWLIGAQEPIELYGDYLTIFEEYRGFYCRGMHRRTVPWDKNFFVFSNLDSSAFDSFEIGIGYATNLGPGLAHWIEDDEMQSFRPLQPVNSDKSINWYNDRIDSTVDCVCTIVLPDGSVDTLTIDSLRYGVTNMLYEEWSIPPTIRLSKIYLQRIMRQSPPHRNFIALDLPQDSLMINWVTAHEIGHQVGIIGHNLDDTTSVMYVDPLRWQNIPFLYDEIDTAQFNVKNYRWEP